MKPFLHQPMSQSAVQKPSLNPKQQQCRCRSTVARKNSLESQESRKKPREEPSSEGWPILLWLCRVEIITEHGQDVHMFIDDQQGQIIIITVVVEGATGQHLSGKYQLAFHSRSFRVRDSRCGRERESKSAGPGQGSTSGEQCRVL